MLESLLFIEAGDGAGVGAGSGKKKYQEPEPAKKRTGSTTLFTGKLTVSQTYLLKTSFYHLCYKTLVKFICQRNP